MDITVYNIVWDTDNQKVDLPNKVVISISKEVIEDFGIENAISDVLSDSYGSCHHSFEYLEFAINSK